MTVAAPPSIKVANFINGQWNESTASEWRDVVNPATGETIASVPLGGAADVNAAVEATLATADDLCVRPLPGCGERC